VGRRKAALRRECKAVQSQGYKIANSRARRETRKPAIRRTAARAIPKAQGLRVVAVRVVVPRVEILRVAVPKAGALRLVVPKAGALRVGILRPGLAVLKPGPNSPTLNNPRSEHPT
jgi:hypothetical protein